MRSGRRPPVLRRIDRLALGIIGFGLFAGSLGLSLGLGRPLVTNCPTLTGGDAGVDAQLRHVEVTDRQVTFTFGPSAASDRFGVPQFRFETLDGGATWSPPELDTGTRRTALSFAGASAFNPDLTPSYQGPSVLVPERAGLVRETRVLEDTARRMSWAVTLERLACPTLTTNTYVWGKSPRAQVTLSFDDRPWITTEHASAYVGTPILSPVLVTGMGFRANTTVSLRLAGTDVGASVADGAGRIEVSFAVPRLLPGFYELRVRDASGREARSRLMVTDER